MNSETLVTSHPYPCLPIHFCIFSEPFKSSRFNLINLYNLKCKWWIMSRFNDYVPGTVIEADENGWLKATPLPGKQLHLKKNLKCPIQKVTKVKFYVQRHRSRLVRARLCVWGYACMCLWWGNDFESILAPSIVPLRELSNFNVVIPIFPRKDQILNLLQGISEVI